MNTTLEHHPGRVHAADYRDFRARYAPWAPDTRDAVIQDIVVRLVEPTGARGPETDTGTLLMGRLFFPRAVRKALSKERLEYLTLLDDRTIAYLAVKAHRTFGKTTWVCIFCARSLLTREHPFLLFTSSEYKIASRRTEFIRASLTGNAEIREIFGNLKPQRSQKALAAFSEDAFFLTDPSSGLPFAAVSPRGSNQTVNGSIAPLGGDNLQRVTLIINDDGQSRKNIHNGNVRQTYEEWCEDELYQTVETDEQPGSDNRWPSWPAPGRREPWRVIAMDTPKHRLAEIEKYFSNGGWVARAFPAWRRGGDGSYRSAHEIYSDATIQRMAERFRTRPDSWAREFGCMAMADDSGVYARSMFHYCCAAAEVKRRPGCFRFLVVDPSRVGHEKANPTSILAVAVDSSMGGRIILRKNIVACMESTAYYKAIFDLCRETGTVRVYIEETGLAGVLRNAIQTAAGLHGVLDEIEFVWLNSRRHPGVEYGSGEDAVKIARAGAMLPYYRDGLVLHDEAMENGDLEKRLLEWPDCTEWGPTDTLGYIPEILEREGIHMEGADSGLGPIGAEESEEYEAAARFFEGRRWRR